MKRLLKQLLGDEKGATVIEYGLLAAIISIGLIAFWQQIGFDLRPIFQKASDDIDKGLEDAQK